jgi:predicted transcriptional regulator
MPAPDFAKAQLIRELQAKGLNQSQIAAELGCHQTNISQISRAHGILWYTGAAAKDQTGNKNPAFIDGLSRSTVRRTAINALMEADRDLHTCERCGAKSDEGHHKHHKDRDRSNNEPSNLEVLCHSCHTLEHSSERLRNAQGQYIG